ncbi:MAG: divergent polysaccharide deacetylase family protein [Deltaproteobacteria bacterium]|nr:divergent polysaccharide deacetylase family protein [Deltaproteobacteria bacterium]MBW2045172.1 divergent polysaccharide deacetylase family protein [Deltaproteobacteria bacterium]
MEEKRKLMDRRKFLVRGASFLMGSLLGLNTFSRAFACNENYKTSLLQPCIALIIDDIGCSVRRARQFLELGAPITFAVLPRLSWSEKLAFEIHSEGHEIMLHQPMEPIDSRINPGPGALYAGDAPGRITKVLEENISAVPFAKGVNNHMGSRFTACEREMFEALEIVKGNGLFFVDSLTTNRSKGYKTARKLHIPSAARNIFLDNRLDLPDILNQLRRLKKIALKYGHSIAIGHPFPETARAIGLFLGEDIKHSNIKLVHISSLVLSK